MRQYAAVLLRKRYSKWKNWLALPEHIRNEFKAVMLQVINFVNSIIYIFVVNLSF